MRHWNFRLQCSIYSVETRAASRASTGLRASSSKTGSGSVLLAIRKFRLIDLCRIIQIPLIKVRLVTSIRYIRGFIE